LKCLTPPPFANTLPIHASEANFRKFTHSLARKKSLKINVSYAKITFGTTKYEFSEQKNKTQKTGKTENFLDFPRILHAGSRLG